MEKSRLLFRAVVFAALALAVFHLWNISRVSRDSLLVDNNIHLENLQLEDNAVKGSYTYESFYTNLTSAGVQMIPIENNIFLEQIFPDGQIWQYKDKKGEVTFIIDSPTKTGENVVVEGKITEKKVTIKTENFDYNQDNIKDRLVLSSLTFKDAALCCNQKFYLGVFREFEGELKLVHEQELDIGKTNAEIKDFHTRDLNRDGKEELLELQLFGDSYTGAYADSVDWYLLQDGKFVKVWAETLSLDTTDAGRIWDEEKENYQAVFDLLYQSNDQYPQIKVVKSITKKGNKKLLSPEQEVTYYEWDEGKKIFVATNSSSL